MTRLPIGYPLIRIIHYAADAGSDPDTAYQWANPKAEAWLKGRSFHVAREISTFRVRATNGTKTEEWRKIPQVQFYLEFEDENDAFAFKMLFL